ncbi:hypothetical protein PT974_08935 [Cladobotryum mycophilum]|uniref:Tubulin-specific chaperone A n=1 Tax=Cladobotryum mycophilum TaxID=491253 RepID=A0ABR0SG50_9HYPO
MPPPSPLAIATGAVNRLVKEESTYHKELVDGETELKKLEEKLKSGEQDEDGNAEFLIRQQRTSVEQTKAVFSPLKKKIEAAVEKLNDLAQSAEKDGIAPPAELENAKTALANAKAALEKSS